MYLYIYIYYIYIYVCVYIYIYIYIYIYLIHLVCLVQQETELYAFVLFKLVHRAEQSQSI